MDSSQWTQEYGVAAKAAMGGAGESAACTLIRPAAAAASSVSMERKVRPQKEQVINCPRCQSTNTKFCYYNNYSLTQPRYFCKTCRRYWTEGGTLRNVPVGGGSRKNNKRSSSSSNSSSPASSNKLLINNLPDLNPPTTNSHFSNSSHQNPKLIHHHNNDQGQDLNLGFQAPHQDYHHHHGNNNIPQFLEFPKIIQNRDLNSNNNSSSSTTTPLSALNFLRSGIGSYNPTFIPMAPASGNNVDHHHQANALFASANFPFQECKPSSLAFTFDADRYGNPNHDQPDQNSNNGTLMFTLGSAPKQQQQSTTTTATDHDQADDHKGHGNGINGYWNGMLGGGSW